ncbi:UbiA family prenyltransferase [Methanohalophilus euhalobius]|uniref:UbiA family prenyltransferase n=1 Tax=Methanohalophilus euhalobius TaxID=51203 RepID=UPI001FB37706|nr:MULTISPECIES: UbiA family prenyltransferase [Methanohalophilus]
MLSVPLGPVILIFIGLNIVISVLYSMHLKRIFLLKNISIAYCFMATILFGSIISDVEIEPLAGYYMLMAFLAGLGYEIMIDIPDMEGDRACGISTLACCVSPPCCRNGILCPIFGGFSSGSIALFCANTRGSLL